MEITHLLGYAGAVATGLVLGLLGGGGALLSIPVLVYLFHIPASVATGYSLFLVGVTASSGALQNIRKQMVDYTAALYYGIPSVITVYVVRRFFIPNLPDVIFSAGSFTLSKDHLILFVLATAMFGVSYKMLTDKAEPDEKKAKHLNHRFMLIVSAVLIGTFLGLVGAGGGFLMIPALVYFVNLPMKKAIGTTLLLVAVNSFIGFLGDVHANANMDWKFLLIFSAFSVSGMFAGQYLGHFVNNYKLKKAFGWFVLVVATYIVVRETIHF